MAESKRQRERQTQRKTGTERHRETQIPKAIGPYKEKNKMKKKKCSLLLMYYSPMKGDLRLGRVALKNEKKGKEKKKCSLLLFDHEG